MTRRRVSVAAALPARARALAALLLAALAVAALALAAPSPARAAGEAATRASLARQMALAGRASGAFVVDLDSGRELFAARPDEPRPPASVQKLYTTAAALLRYGTEEPFETEVLASVPPDAGGVIAGDLWVRGGGDPTLDGAALARLAGQVAGLGVTEVQGRVRGDESAFDALRGPPSSGYRLSPWVGPLSALAVNGGRTGNRFPYWQVDPPRFAARAFTAALRRAGVRVRQSARVGPAPDGVPVLTAVASPTIGEIVQRVNVPSDNHAAETLLKGLGRRFADIGSTDAGAQVVATAVGDLGVRPQVVDGSGLSYANRTSPRDVVRLLAGLAAAEAGPAFAASLAVAGRTGTLRRRMRGSAARGRCRAKTGTLIGISALAGYCDTTGGARVAYAFLMTRVSVTGARRLQDTMTGALARYTPDAVPTPPVAAAAAAPSP